MHEKPPQGGFLFGGGLRRERSHMTDIAVRPARPSDLTEIHAMIRALAAYHDDTATVTLSALQDLAFDTPDQFDLIVACRGERVIGYAALAWHRKLQTLALVCDIQHLYVIEAERSRGIGRALIKAAEQTARAAEASVLTIGTDPANAAAQAAYRAIGLEEIKDTGPRFRRVLDSMPSPAA